MVNLISFFLIIFMLAASKTTNERVWYMTCGLILLSFMRFFPAVILVPIYLVYFIIRMNTIKTNGYLYNNREKTSRMVKEERLNALKEAKIYLAPYKSIWLNLKLINKYCKLTLGSDGATIEGFEKAYPYRHFKIIDKGVHTSEELWNMFCKYFSWNKSYDGLLEDCKRYRVTYIENIGDRKKIVGKSELEIPDNKRRLFYELPEENTSQTMNSPSEYKTPEIKQTPKEKLDINNCSEAELTALPGISIVLAKKVVKKREEIGGFKKIDDFFLYLKLKPHMENQLKELIKVEKMKGSVTRILNTERKIDL